MDTLSQGNSKRKSVTAKGKTWQLPKLDLLDAELMSVVDNCEPLARLLQRRGIATSEKAKAFLDPQEYIPTSPMELPDVDKAVVRISQAIALGERITVYGDYDVDGVTATSLLITVLKKLGASVNYYIPNRLEEGYGLNLKAVSILASKQRTKLIITCDCGIGNFAEINFAKSLGVETVVLDHHMLPELMPPAVAIVHPKLLDAEHPLFDLPGVGVAYKVCEALLIDKGLEEEVKPLLDYVTLGMIADLVPLVRENRYLVQIGLPCLINSTRPGIRALLAQVRKSEDTDLVGFGLAPRINAVGRLADAKVAVELLTTDDVQLADSLAANLQTENAKRQELCERIFAEADYMVSTKVDLENDKAIAIYKSDWHHGVVGIVASRLVEKYGRPVFIAELDEVEGIIKGSARSIDTIDLYAVLKANESLLSKWGGHKMAAGFSTASAKAEILCRALVDTINRTLGDKPLSSTLTIDVLVQADAVNLELAKTFFKLAPFGMSNKKPLLYLNNLSCEGTRTLGKEGKHHRLNLVDKDSKTQFECVMWNSQGRIPADGELIDLVFIPEVNSYNGRERLQLVVSDWRVTGSGQETVPIEEDGKKPLVKLEEVGRGAPSLERLEPIEQPLIQLAPAALPDKEPSSRANLKDLREHNNRVETLKKAIDKFGANVAIFAESNARPAGLSCADRIEISAKEHLVIWQYPPSLKIFQDILLASKATSVYLVGQTDENAETAGTFIKQLLGLVRFAINKRDGQVEAEKLVAAMATTKMALALGLGALKKVNVIDWYAEGGVIYLDLLGSPIGKTEDLSEYTQLTNILTQISQFRQWCAEASLKEVELALASEQIGLASTPNQNFSTSDSSFPITEPTAVSF
jgi:single-stranded-DNA-specific exonuclease RecJ